MRDPQLTTRSTSPHLRADDSRAHRVTDFELFFDLVYVFAITQLSHGLAADLTWGGAARNMLLLLAVWWAWVYTAWATNWIDPNSRPVRLMLIGVMAAALVMATAIPNAFEDGPYGLIFAAAYSALQLVRSGFVLWAFRGQDVRFRNFERIMAWHVAASAVWIAGGLAGPEIRPVVWTGALIVDYAGPILRYPAPLLGRSRVDEWVVEGAHFAERFRLFIILALGESIVVTGATISGVGLDFLTTMALVLAFAGAVGFWWIYFDRAAERGSTVLEQARDPGRLARSAYTYFHLPIVGGIILAAVADELVIAHPWTDAEPGTAIVTLAGPAIFLAGHALYKRATWRVWSASRLVAAALLVTLIPFTDAWPPLVTGAVALAVVAIVAAYDTFFVREVDVAEGEAEIEGPGSHVAGGR